MLVKEIVHSPNFFRRIASIFPEHLPLLLLELKGLLLELEGARAPLSLMLGAMSCQLSLLGALSLITLGVCSVAGTLRL